MSPLLSMLVVEGLVGMVRQTTSLRELRGFHFNYEIHFELL